MRNHLMLVHIQCGGVLLHHHIRDKDRIVGNIASSQIQKPGHFIQGSYQKRPSTFLCMYIITLPLRETGWLLTSRLSIQFVQTLKPKPLCPNL